ncbi:MAG: hypothetical protein ACRD3Q_06385 [Terriglobales bacterium]
MAESDFNMEFHALLSEPQSSGERAPSSLKARLYSALIRKQQESGPLASLTASVKAGRAICVFEKMVQITPAGEQVKSSFFCEVCHARVLAEHFDHPPIFWPGCPYVDFKKS